jgi:hypothetical protein
MHFLSVRQNTKESLKINYLLTPQICTQSALPIHRYQIKLDLVQAF